MQPGDRLPTQAELKVAFNSGNGLIQQVFDILNAEGSLLAAAPRAPLWLTRRRISPVTASFSRAIRGRNLQQGMLTSVFAQTCLRRQQAGDLSFKMYQN